MAKLPPIRQFLGQSAGWLLALYAFGVLSIGVTRDWRLRHEDNGALQTTLALSHVRLGLARTRAHDLFFNPHTGEATPYGHHPPATGLLLAGSFALTGSDSPAVARLTVIGFQLGSIWLLTSLLTRLCGRRLAIVGGLVMATLPMSSYFGRMVNYEPLCLFAVLLQLHGYARFKSDGQTRGLIWLGFGVVLGGLTDWPSFFFTAALASVEAIDLVRRRSSSKRLLGLLVTTAAAIVLFDLVHLWYAGRGAMALASVLSSNRPVWEQEFTIARFCLGQVDTFRRYFSHVGLLAVLLVAGTLAFPRTSLSRRMFDVPNANLIKRLLLATGGAALGYVLAAPRWAMMHQYWQFYFLPFVVVSIVLGWGLLGRAIVERPTVVLRWVRVACVLEVVISSVFWLHFRHTRVESYAVKTTAMFRSTFLAPESVGHDPE